jgi:hypothetical protein
MNTSLFIPEKIKVGFQNRSDTYTGKLAYVIYYDEKGVLRKENSWNGWRDKSIEPNEFNNEPTSGFVLNKKVGGYKSHWNMRQTYVRIYDPRGFEFEITIPNLIYILENCTSTVGKGIEGEFVYAWEGTELVLLPVNSPDYKECVELTKIIKENNYVKPSELEVGHIYEDKRGGKYLYVGRFDKYGYSTLYADFYGRPPEGLDDSYQEDILYSGGGCKKWHKPISTGKKYWFSYIGNNGKASSWFETYNTVSKKFVRESQDSYDDWNSIVEMLSKDIGFCPIDFSKDTIIPISSKQLKSGRDKHLILKNKDTLEEVYFSNTNDGKIYVNRGYFSKYQEDVLEPYTYADADLEYKFVEVHRFNKEGILIHKYNNFTHYYF